MKLQDFADLAAAQAYTETVDNKQVGSGKARGYLANTNDLWKTLKVIQADITHPLFSLADTIITTASDANSFFGMDDTKEEGKANRAALATLVSLGIMTQEDADGFLAKTLSTSKPFELVDQAELDAAKASAVLLVPTEAHTIVYGETQLDYMIKLPNQDIKFFVVFDATPTEDTIVDIFVWEQPVEAVPHAITAKTNILRTKAGDITTADVLTKNYKRNIKFSAVCNKSIPFTLHVV